MSPRFTLTARSPSGLRVTDIVRDATAWSFIAALTNTLDAYRTRWTRLIVDMDGVEVGRLVCEDNDGVLTWRTETVKAGV